jgi:hypothetical protein
MRSRNWSVLSVSDDCLCLSDIVVFLLAERVVKKETG